MCKRMVLPLMLLSLAMVMWAGSAFAYLITDYGSSATLVRENYSYTSDDAPGGWVDVIGPTNQFQVHGINITDIGGDISFELFTNFNNDGLYSVGGSTAYLADLAIDTDLTDPLTFDYGARLLAPSFYSGGGDPKPSNTSLAQGVYKATSWDTSKELFEGRSGLTYGGHWHSDPPTTAKEANVAIAGVDGSALSGITITKTNLGGTGNPGSPIYKWTIDIPEVTLTNSPTDDGSLGWTPGMGLSDGDHIGVFWGGATCANDIIYGEVIVDLNDGGFDPIPEPGTLLLLGFGLLGLAGYTIHRKKKS